MFDNIMEPTNYSDYGSGSSVQNSPWGNHFRPSPMRSVSVSEGVPTSVDAVMEEFRNNGSDSPYDPDEDTSSVTKYLSGMGPPRTFLRTTSCPEKKPVNGLPQPQDLLTNGGPSDFLTNSPIEVPSFCVPDVPAGDQERLTEQQMRVLRSIPNAVLYPLLRELEKNRQRANGRKQEEQECRFCKNNGERASYYRSHALRSGGRVQCPVLRAFVCRRCGARGDSAHTLKYCPLTSAEERNKSAAMMRSLRSAAIRRRQAPSTGMQDFVLFGETTPTVIADGSVYNNYEFLPLDPIWAALEQKLML